MQPSFFCVRPVSQRCEWIKHCIDGGAGSCLRHWGIQAVGEVQPDPFRNIILFLLLGLAAAAWVALVWPAHNMTMHITMASPITGPQALRFLAIWVVMMVAMMLPTAAPMILAFHSAQTDKRHPDVAFDSTWAFVAAYLLVWAVSGIAAYAGVLAAAAVRPALGTAAAEDIGGLILMVAGIYQLSPVKQRCLSECRRPIIMTSWHDKTAAHIVWACSTASIVW